MEFTVKERDDFLYSLCIWEFNKSMPFITLDLNSDEMNNLLEVLTPIAKDFSDHETVKDEIGWLKKQNDELHKIIDRLHRDIDNRDMDIRCLKECGDKNE